MTDTTPIEVKARTVSESDSVAIYSARGTTPRYVRVRRVTEDPGSVRIDLQAGPPLILNPGQKIKVAPRTKAR